MATAVEAMDADRRLLWGLCYRMTGNAADADDLVQETFLRSIERPPQDKNRPLRPWLIKVAINLSRDLLRVRKRRGYQGPWLPSPIPSDEIVPGSFEPAAPDEDSPAARYDLLESISFAFLLALEALSPLQRAVLLLRDVFDYSTSEAAEVLGTTEANVKVVLHRARKRMNDYDRERQVPNNTKNAATRKALEEFLLCLQARDVDALEKLLTEDVVFLSDGGGEVAAAQRPVRGVWRGVRLVMGLNEKAPPPLRVEFVTLNASPFVIVEYDIADPRFASRVVVSCDLDDRNRIRRFYSVVAPSKLTAVR